jgi:hypothetical protein
MPQIAEWMRLAIDHRDDTAELAKLRTDVAEFLADFPVPTE